MSPSGSLGGVKKNHRNPAFGEFTGGFDVSRKDYCRVFAVSSARVLPVYL